MRPLELRLRNFRSYWGDDHTFDFRGRRLVGIVGPIGAGKSSILDAIAFGLYGRTPRIARSTRSLIHQRAEAATVLFRFSVDDEIWEAVRSIRVRGQSQHALYRYERDEPDAEPVEKILQEGEVNTRIEALLGFDYDAFGRSVLLAQGQFAQFLTARPAERDKVLKGVFGHDRIDAMREAAKAKVAEHDHEIEKLAIRLENVEAAVARIGERRAALAEAEERVARLEKSEPEISELAAAGAEAAERVRTAAAHLEELERLAARLPDTDASNAAIARAVAARTKRAELAARHEEVHAEMAGAEQVIKSEEHAARVQRLATAAESLVRLDGARAAAGAAAERLEAGRTAVTKAGEQAERASDRLEAATAAAEAAAGALATARADAERAEQQLHEARHADMAATLRSQLATGEPCPVCARPVEELPAAEGGVAIGDFEDALEQARTEREAADRSNLEAQRELEAARSVSETTGQRREELAKAVGELEAELEAAAAQEQQILVELEEALGSGEPAELIAAERAAIDQLNGAVETARRRVDEARRELDAAITNEQEADRTLGDLRTQLSALAGRLDAAAEVPEDDPAALAEALVSLREGWVTRTSQLTEEREQASAAAAEAGERTAALLAELEVEGEFTVALAESRARTEMLRTAVAEDEALVASSEALILRRDELEASQEWFRRLQADLTDAKFIRFLLDEERTLLADLGSEHFQRLSSGRYRFTDDGDFHVVDLTAADAIRRPDSLSGGETFLASLGLALGLAEMVGRTGGRLDAFFLDEGFGTLDAEHLDLAMEGIEALVSEHPDRIVVVVSHVPELRHRIEDLIELDRHPVTGDSIIKAGSGGGQP